MNEFSFYHIVNERANKSKRKAEYFVEEYVEQPIVEDCAEQKVTKCRFRKPVRFMFEGLIAVATVVVGFWFMAIMTLIV